MILDYLCWPEMQLLVSKRKAKGDSGQNGRQQCDCADTELMQPQAKSGWLPIFFFLNQGIDCSLEPLVGAGPC